MTDTLEKLVETDPRVKQGTAHPRGVIELCLAPGWLNQRNFDLVVERDVMRVTALLNADVRAGYVARPPRPERYNPECKYLHDLIELAGLEVEEVARLAGLTARSIRNYLNPDHDSRHPYLLQWMLETLADPHGGLEP